MIPTVTYEQVRIEQQAGLAGLELRRHAHATEPEPRLRATAERLNGFVPGGLRVAIATAGVVVATLVVLIS